MSIYEFNVLSEHDQYDLVFTKGQFVDTVSDENVKYVLYALSYFWIEIKYHSLSNKIIEIGSFVAGKTLDR